MLWRSSLNQLIAQLFDILTTVASFFVAYFTWRLLTVSLRNLPLGGEFELSNQTILLAFITLIIWQILFKKHGAYSYQRFTAYRTEIKFVFQTVLMGILILLSLIFTFRLDYIPRSLLGIFAITNFVFLSAEKLFLFISAKTLRRKGYNRKMVLIVGRGNNFDNFMIAIKNNFSWGLDIVGILCLENEEENEDIHGVKVLGGYGDILKIMHSFPLDDVVITMSSNEFEEMKTIIEICEMEGIPVRIISDFMGNLSKNIRIDMIYGLPIISVYNFPENDWRLFVKRLIDIWGSAAGLILLSPLFMIIALLIKFTSKGSILYKWKVVGKNKSRFTSYKFRTMVMNADIQKKSLYSKNEMSGPAFKMSNDPRITKVGKVLRKYSLDELPQLWSVLKGDMSLVGPRPPLVEEFDEYDNWHRRKLSVIPGITCLWQINGRNDISEFNTWAKLDLEYIDNWSLLLDIKILFLTIPAVILGRGVK